MQSIDMTDKVKKVIGLSLAGVVLLSLIIGYAEYKYWHKDETIILDDAKVSGTMVSVRVLTNGKVKELLFEDGAEVKAGDVIARLEVAITEEEIKQLENTVQLAKDNYAQLAQGQWVKVPVQRERVTYPPASSSSASSGNLDKLKERANRMAELFEMGAVSAVQRDAARRAYESALAESSSASYGSSSAPIIEYYTEYVDEFRETPAEVLAGAEQAIKQAELSLNVAKQEARESDVIAPVSGTIYYGVKVEQDLAAGDSVSRIGDSRELWLEAQVTEEIFDKIPLGKLATFSIDGKEIFGTVIEKIKPNISTQPEETQEPVELPDIPTSENQVAPLIGENQPAENPQQNPEAPPAENPAPQPPKIPDKFEEQQKPNDKFIIKISMPAERDFDCPPNTSTKVKIKI
ncbi:MAG: biotin/lipoyl-binding protein [Selenomonadaceae bacterium]|nr:biotin/lipoyl-binding protein [Selenomonadaceae bacterium]